MPQLTVNEASYGGLTHVFDIDFNDLIALGNGGQKTLFTLPAGSGVDLCVVHKVTAAAGSTTVVFDVGTTTGDPDELIDALDADAMTAPISNTGDSFTSIYEKMVCTTASAIPMYFEVNDAAVASLTAGRWIIGFRVIDMGRFSATQ